MPDRSQSTDHFFVTGAASGVGLSFVEIATKRGAYCTILDSDELALERINFGPQVTKVHGDVRSARTIRDALERGISTAGRFSGFFNNAGILGKRAALHEATSKQWSETLDVNLTGVWCSMKAELSYCLSEGSGAIVNNASISGVRGSRCYPVYAAAKHGVVGLTRSAALWYGAYGVRVNAIASSLVETPMTRRERERYGGTREEDALANPLNRVAKPQDVAEAALWLLSPQAAHINGHTMILDGGQNA